jgi:predicted secreted protein
VQPIVPYKELNFQQKISTFSPDVIPRAKDPYSTAPQTISKDRFVTRFKLNSKRIANEGTSQSVENLNKIPSAMLEKSESNPSKVNLKKLLLSRH